MEVVVVEDDDEVEETEGSRKNEKNFFTRQPFVNYIKNFLFKKFAIISFAFAFAFVKVIKYY